MRNSSTSEYIIRLIFLFLGILNIGFVLLISIYLIIKGLPAIFEIGLYDFLFGSTWKSTATPPQFGILPFILTSIYGTAGAIVLGVPIGFFTALYLAKIASKRVQNFIIPLVDLLASIPSVVYGLIGMLCFVPLTKEVFNLSDGASLFVAIIVLAIMILPSIIKVSVEFIKAVPKEYEEGSLALGANKVETYMYVVIPACKKGIAAAVVLGVGRAVGESVAIIMVAGNAPNLPSLFESVRFLTTAIVSEMAYSSGLQKDALFSIGLVLFVFILLINATLNLLLKRDKNA